MVARIKAGIFTSFNAKKVTLRGFPKQSVLLTGRKVLAKAAVAAGENSFAVVNSVFGSANLS